jgi:hypothetical protein
MEGDAVTATTNGPTLEAEDSQKFTVPVRFTYQEVAALLTYLDRARFHPMHANERDQRMILNLQNQLVWARDVRDHVLRGKPRFLKKIMEG